MRKMQLDYCFLEKTSLFKYIKTDEIESMMKCLSAQKSAFKKGEFIYKCGDKNVSMGVVLSGSILIFKEDFWGNRSIISEVSQGQLFAQTYSINSIQAIEVSVSALEDSEILFLDIGKVMSVCSSACKFHERLIRNLLEEIADKNLQLTRKLDCMAQRTTREKLLEYLSNEALRSGSNRFTIPFDRQQMADYLCVDRSALSNELSKLQKEGILSFKKNKFKLICDNEL